MKRFLVLPLLVALFVASTADARQAKPAPPSTATCSATPALVAMGTVTEATNFLGTSDPVTFTVSGLSGHANYLGIFEQTPSGALNGTPTRVIDLGTVTSATVQVTVTSGSPMGFMMIVYNKSVVYAPSNVQCWAFAQTAYQV